MTKLQKKNFSLSLLLHRKLKMSWYKESCRNRHDSTKTYKNCSWFLTPLFTAGTNKSREENIFPDYVKIASVIPLDKEKPNKNEISN